MQIEKELAGLSPEKDMLLTIGVFDGVHLGHKYLLSQLTKQAINQNLLSGVITFCQHPQEILLPQTTLPFLTDLSERTSLLKDEGIDKVIPISFTNELAELSARQFIYLLKKYLRMRRLLIGPDFVLGKKREGNQSTLHTLGEEMNFATVVIPPLMINGKVISSTAIRKALANGDIKQVTNFLGHPFRCKGQVVTGTRRGKDLGYPTANLKVRPKQALPAEGVYAALAYIDNQACPSVTNIGRCPTFGSNECSVEVHILDYQENLYRRTLIIDIIERLRDEKRFSSAEELKNQIAVDVEQSRKILNTAAEIKYE